MSIMTIFDQEVQLVILQSECSQADCTWASVHTSADDWYSSSE